MDGYIIKNLMLCYLTIMEFMLYISVSGDNGVLTQNCLDLS